MLFAVSMTFQTLKFNVLHSYFEVSLLYKNTKLRKTLIHEFRLKASPGLCYAISMQLQI